MTTAIEGKTTTTDAARGFKGLRCLKCGVKDGVYVDLSDLDCFGCNDCGEDFTRADVVAFMEMWAPVLTWLNAAPDLD